MSLIFVGKHLQKGNHLVLEKLPLNQVGMVVDIDRCIRCHGCEVACSLEKKLPDSVRLNPQIQIGPKEEHGRFLLLNFSMRCAQCNDPQCSSVCPVNAYNRDHDGFVLQNQERCIGCQLCRLVCPYGAPKYHPDEGKVIKCDFCVEKVRIGESPSCSSKCIMKAIHFGKLKDLLQSLREKISEGKGILILGLTRGSAEQCLNHNIKNHLEGGSYAS